MIWLILLVLLFSFPGCICLEDYSYDEEGGEIILNYSYFPYYPLAYEEAFKALNVPDVEINLTNTANFTIDATVTVRYLDYSLPYVRSVHLEPNETEYIEVYTTFIHLKTKELKTPVIIPLQIKVEYDNDTLIDTVNVKLYPLDTALLYENGDDFYDYLPVFVNPKDPEVEEVIRKADFEFYGYGCYDCETDEEWLNFTAPQVEALYNVLKYEYGVRYVDLSYDFSTENVTVQRIVFPSEILAGGHANCLDGTLFFASLLEAIGLHPYIAIIPGHAFLVWDVDPEGEWVSALETTAISTSDFWDAVDIGMAELDLYWENLTDDDPKNGYLVDVVYLHSAGVLPFSG